MGFIDYIAKRTVASQYKSLSSSDAAFFFGDARKSDSNPFDDYSVEEQLKTMQNNTVVYACVMAKATAFQQARLTVQEKVNGEWVEKKEHYLLDPFKNNPWLNESDFLQYIQIHLNLAGKCFIWKWYDKRGEVAELWPIPPQWVSIVVSEDIKKKRVVEGYWVDYQDGTKPVFIPLDDMCYLRYPDPLNLYDGLSPVQASIRNIQLDMKGDLYRGESMDALTLPGITISIKDKMVSQEQKDDIRAVLRQKMGSDARKNALILNGSDVDVAVMNPMEKFNWAEYTEMNESRICAAFRVPPIVVGVLTGLRNSPWANIDAAQQWFYSSTMVSEWELAARGFSRWLIGDDYRESLRFYFDVSSVPQMKGDVAALEKRSIDLFNSSVITLNEARERIGLPKLPNGDSIKINAATVWVDADETVGIPAYDLRNEDNDGSASADTYGDDESDREDELAIPDESANVGY